MKTLSDISVLMTLFGAAYSVVTIPDFVPQNATRLVYYSTRGTWYQADRVCRARGGYLVFVEGPDMAHKLQRLRRTIGGLKTFLTRMVRHDNRDFYSHDAKCRTVNTSLWSWKTNADSKWDPYFQCVVSDDVTFQWKKQGCDAEDEFVCEYPLEDACGFRLTSVSLASVPVADASMAVCQSTCQQMIGCFATAPSGHATVPPFTHCLFVVTGDDSNPMATLDDCPDLYEADSRTDPAKYPAPDGSSEDADPKDCAPRQIDPVPSVQRSLVEFVKEANADVDCTKTVIYPTPVVETAYVTLTPDVLTAYVTVSPDIHTAYVTVTPSLPERNLIMTTVVEQMVTVTVTVTSLSGPGSPAELDAGASALITTTVPSNLQPETQTLTANATATATTTITTTFCPPQPSSTAGPDVTTTTTTTTTTVSDNNNNISGSMSTSHSGEENPEGGTRSSLDMNSLVQELTLNPDDVSKARRRKESAPDVRTSARTMGAVAGVVLTLVAVLVVALDASRLFRDVQRLQRVLGPGSLAAAGSAAGSAAARP